jgi:hypothetical protein
MPDLAPFRCLLEVHVLTQRVTEWFDSNADDPVACLATIRLAAAYRAQFAEDFPVDLIG